MRVGRIKPFVMKKKQELDEWSIYVEGLSKPYNTEQSIRELFNSLVGHVSYFRIPPNQKGQQIFFGYCFIEFDNKDHVNKAVEIVNRYHRGEVATETIGDNTSKIDKLNLRVMSK
jgi:RNA recognition motif-containing protein